MKTPLRYCAHKEKSEGGSSRFSVKVDDAAGTLTCNVDTSLPGKGNQNRSRYTVKLRDLDPQLVRFTPIASDRVSWMNLVCRDYLDAVQVERAFSDSESINRRQCYLPLPIARPRFGRPNIPDEFQAWIMSHCADVVAESCRLGAGVAEKIMTLLEPANDVIIPSNSGSREFRQEVQFLISELTIERKMGTKKRFNGRWRFPILALDGEPPSLEPLGSLTMLKLNCRLPLSECEWYTGHGSPTDERQIGIAFQSESDASTLGDFLHSTVTRFRADQTKP